MQRAQQAEGMSSMVDEQLAASMRGNDKGKAGRRRRHHVTLEELREMSDNCLKRLCRKFGISRWPYRKLASLDALTQTLKSDGGKDCEALREAVRREYEKILNDPDAPLDETLKYIRSTTYKDKHLKGSVGKAWGASTSRAVAAVLGRTSGGDAHSDDSDSLDGGEECGSDGGSVESGTSDSEQETMRAAKARKPAQTKLQTVSARTSGRLHPRAGTSSGSSLVAVNSGPRRRPSSTLVGSCEQAAGTPVGAPTVPAARASAHAPSLMTTLGAAVPQPQPAPHHFQFHSQERLHSAAQQADSAGGVPWVLHSEPLPVLSCPQPRPQQLQQLQQGLDSRSEHGSFVRLVDLVDAQQRRQSLLLQQHQGWAQCMTTSGSERLPSQSHSQGYSTQPSLHDTSDTSLPQLNWAAFASAPPACGGGTSMAPSNAFMQARAADLEGFEGGNVTSFTDALDEGVLDRPGLMLPGPSGPGWMTDPMQPCDHQMQAAELKSLSGPTPHIAGGRLGSGDIGNNAPRMLSSPAMLQQQQQQQQRMWQMQQQLQHQHQQMQQQHQQMQQQEQLIQCLTGGSLPGSQSSLYQLASSSQNGGYTSPWTSLATAMPGAPAALQPARTLPTSAGPSNDRLPLMAAQCQSGMVSPPEFSNSSGAQGCASEGMGLKSNLLNQVVAMLDSRASAPLPKLDPQSAFGWDLDSPHTQAMGRTVSDSQLPPDFARLHLSMHTVSGGGGGGDWMSAPLPLCGPSLAFGPPSVPGLASPACSGMEGGEGIECGVEQQADYDQIMDSMQSLPGLLTSADIMLTSMLDIVDPIAQPPSHQPSRDLM